MSNINQKLVDNTKIGVTELLKHMEKVSDSFVDFIVKEKPDVFSQPDNNGSGIIDPFVIIGLMNKQLDTKFKAFEALQKATDSVSSSVKTEANVLTPEFGKKPTTH